jgi:hypothetical protein
VNEKQDGTGCNRAYGGSEEDVVGKQDGALKIDRRCPQQFQPSGLVEENGGTPSVLYVEIWSSTVVTLARVCLRRGSKTR